MILVLLYRGEPQGKIELIPSAVAHPLDADLVALILGLAREGKADAEKDEDERKLMAVVETPRRSVARILLTS